MVSTKVKLQYPLKNIYFDAIFVNYLFFSFGMINSSLGEMGCLILLVIPCLFMQYEKILMVWVRITRGNRDFAFFVFERT